MCLDRGAVSAGDFLAGKDDVGQLRVLFVEAGAEQRRGGGALGRVQGAVVFGAVAADVVQGADGVLFGQVFVIYDLGAGRVNGLLAAGGFRLFGLFRLLGLAGGRGLGRVSGLVAVVVIAATAGSNANGHHDCQ